VKLKHITQSEIRRSQKETLVGGHSQEVHRDRKQDGGSMGWGGEGFSVDGDTASVWGHGRFWSHVGVSH
jgi:hypothetical protein